MVEDYPDLRETLAALHRQTRSPRLLWVAAADGFETTVYTRRGVLLGGAWGPSFLRDVTSLAPWGVPWTVTLNNARLALVETATAPMRDWLPLLEAVQQANESLLLAAGTIDRLLLRALSINAARDVLRCCAIRTNPGGSIQEGPRVPPPTSPKTLPLVAEAWVRRSATVIFPGEGSTSIGWPVEVSVIAVGGENLEHQQQRLRYLVRAVEELPGA